MEQLLILENKGKTYTRIKKFRKILLRILLGLFLIIVLFFIVLSLPPVQTYIAKKVTKSINKDFGTNINIDKVLITFYGKVKLKGVYIEDSRKDTLIYVKKLNTSILSVNKAINNHLDFGDVDLYNPYVQIKTYKGDSLSNLDVFIARLEGNDTISSGTPFKLGFTTIAMEKGKFKYIDENLETPDVLDFSNINSEIGKFYLNGPNLFINIKDLNFRTFTGLQVETLSGDYTYTKTDMRIEKLRAKTEKSDVSGNIYFAYDRDELADFFNKVAISGELTNSVINSDDVNLFYNEFGPNKAVLVSTELGGYFNELKTKALHATYESSVIDGDFEFTNLFDSSKPYKIAGNVENITSDYYQLTGLLPNVLGSRLPSNLSRFGTFYLTGEVTVAESFMETHTLIKTEIGSANSDLYITDLQNIDNAQYKGHIILTDFNIGKFASINEVKTVSLTADVNGKGFDRKNLDTKLNGKIAKLNFNNYTYRNMVVDGNVKNQKFEGFFKANDKNFKFNFEGLADLSGPDNIFKFKANVDHANLNALHFVKRDSIANFKGSFDFDIKGNSIDNLAGEINFKQTTYVNQNDTYYFKDFSVASVFDKEGVRTILINSPDIIFGNVRGKYKFDQVLKMVENSVGSIYPNYMAHDIDKDQFIQFNFKIYDKIIDVFYPEIDFGANTHIRGEIFTKDGTFKLNFKSPHIDLFGYVLDDINVKVDNKNPLYNTFIEVSSVKSGFYDIQDFNLINSTINDTLFFRTEFTGGNQAKDNYALNFYHTFNEKHNSIVGLKTSELTIKGNTWLLNKEGNAQNRLIISKNLDSIGIDMLDAQHNNEIITFNGNAIDSTYKDINLNFKNVHLDNITPDIDSLALSGIVDGDFKLFQQNKVYLPNSHLTISNFILNNHLLGDFVMDVSGNKSLTNYDVSVEIINDKFKKLNVYGNVDLLKKEDAINLDLYLRNLDLAPFSPLGGIVLSDLRGFISGDAKITGSFSRPKINGLMNLSGTGLKIPYLGLDLDFSEGSKIALTDETFAFDNVTLIDTQYKTSAALDGTIMHHKFTDWSLDLGVVTNNERFLVLNTEDDGETLFYGTGFLSGTADVYGSIDELNIDIAGITERGTSFKIPINDAVSIGDDSFIEFINKRETKKEAQQRVLKEYSDLELSFDLDITPKAEIEIVTDRKTGSTLKGRGEGTLFMEINTNGKFNMWGDFVTSEGTYNFKNYGIINKTFTVQPGGSITWEGDPTRAVLQNLKAVYHLNANPSLLLENNQFNRKIKTDVIINLEGELMNPTTSFDIEFPDTNPVTVSELNYHLQDEDRRQRQAISLLSSGTFFGDSNNTALQGFVTNTIVSESLFSQINNQLGGSDNKLNIGFSYEIGQNNPAYDFRTDDQLGVTISTQISDRILFNGKVGVPVGGVTETVVAGDAEVQILLNDDGTLSAKVFNKQTEIQDFLASTQGYTQGIGLSYQVDFDTFGELWNIIFKGKKKHEEILDNDPEEEKRAREAAKKKQQANKVIESQGDNNFVNFNAKKTNDSIPNTSGD